MKVLAVICARGGSKGLPRKNVLDLNGMPVIAWSVEAAHQARLVERTVLSTDDAEIIAAAKAADCDVPFVRPPELATDTASIYDALFHALDQLGGNFDHVVLLQATSPLRTGSDIDACIELCAATKAPAVVSVTKAAKPPHWMYTVTTDGTLAPAMPKAEEIDRRQEAPDFVVPNGAVYVADIAWLRARRNFISPETRAYLMPPERSIDIDAYLDLVTARAVQAEMQKGGFS